MKLDKFYRRAVEFGIENDPRGKAEVGRLLAEEARKHKDLKPKEAETYDLDRLFNPYADSRLLYGDPESPVRRILVGIDIETPEVLLAHALNKDFKRGIDLLVAHHPEGRAQARLGEVMKLQADILASFGVSVSVAEQLLEKRIGEVERRLMPVNHGRAVDAARLLGLPLICLHTPADNCVTTYLQKLFDREKPRLLRDVLDLLLDIPEYKAAARAQISPQLVNGSEHSRCGKVLVDMTGGTEGSKEVYDRLTEQGVSTVVGMHMSEEHVEQAKKANINVVIAGHISSDSLGLNLLLDGVEAGEKIEAVSASGFERIRHPRKR